MKKSDGFYIENEMLDSEAFEELSGNSVKVLFTFMSKRQIGKVNNGEIQFTYKEAELQGIPRPTFSRAIKQLLEFGFLDITHLGNGHIRGDVSLYSLSERWRKYGEKRIR